MAIISSNPMTWIDRAGLERADHAVPVVGGTLTVTRVAAPADARPPVVLVPGWASSLHSWRHVIVALAATQPVVVVHTREKSASDVPRATQCVDEVVRDVDVAIASLPTPPAWVLGVSTGANVVCELHRRHALRAQTPTVLALPHVRVPVPASVPWLRFLPTWFFRFIGPLAVYLMRPFALSARHRAQYAELFAELERGSLKRLARSAAQWRRYRYVPLPGGGAPSVLVVSVAGDPFHDPRACDDIAANLGADVLRVSGYARLHTRQTAEQLQRWANGLIEVSAGGGPAPVERRAHGLHQATT